MGHREGHHYLVADTRESHVLGFIETVFGQAGVGHTVAQINTGDYLICRRLAGGAPEILAVVERKTLKDFAASFRDGRYANRHKMLDLRDMTGCQLYYFVEGPAFPKPSWKVARTPYGSILSAMTSLMVRDGVSVVQTENEMHTAQRLLDFVQAFEKTPAPFAHPVPGGPARRGAGAAPSAADVPVAVTGLIEKDDALLATELWSRLAGVSLATAKVLVGAFTVADLVSGRVAGEAIAALRTPANRPLHKQGLASLRGLWRGTKKEEVRVLSGIPGVSPAMAAQLLEGRPLATFIAGGPGGMAAVGLQQKGRTARFGEARAERAFRLLTYLEEPGPRTGGAGRGGAGPPPRPGVGGAGGAPAAAAAADAPEAPEALDNEDFDALLGDLSGGEPPTDLPGRALLPPSSSGGEER